MNLIGAQEVDFKAIIKKKHIKELKYLNLTFCCDTWKQILGHQDWSQLRTLSIGKCGVKPDEIQYFKSNPYPNLIELRIHQNKIGKKGVEVICKCNLPFLQSLWISQCDLGDQGVKILMKSNWKNLKKIFIANNKLGLNSSINFSLLLSPNLTHLYSGQFDEEIGRWFSHASMCLHLISMQSRKINIIFGIKNGNLMNQLIAIYKKRTSSQK